MTNITPTNTKPSAKPEASLGRYKPNRIKTTKTYATTTHGVLKRALYGLEKNGQPVYKTLMKCGDFTGRENTAVAMTGYMDGRIVTSGVVRCKNPDCPICCDGVAGQKVSRVKKALNSIHEDGADLAFITITCKPTLDPAKAITHMKKLKSLISRALRNNERGIPDEKRGLCYSTLERTHSSKFAYVDEYGNSCERHAYLHTHLHLCIGSFLFGTPKDPLKMVEGLWRNYFDNEANGMCSSNVATADILFGSNEPTNKVGFQVKYVDDTDEIASYLNKVVDTKDQLSKEMTVSNSKAGAGMNLITLLNKMNEDRDNDLYQAHRKNIRAWFREMFKARRNTETNISKWVDRYDEQQKERILKWCEGREINITSLGDDYKRAYSIPVMDYHSEPLVWLEDESKPVPITKQMREKDIVVFREDIDVRLYNFFRSRGYESTLEHLFRTYWFDEQNSTCYDTYREVNFGFSTPKAHGLLDTLMNHGLIRGSRWKQHDINKTHKEVA